MLKGAVYQLRRRGSLTIFLQVRQEQKRKNSSLCAGCVQKEYRISGAFSKLFWTELRTKHRPL